MNPTVFRPPLRRGIIFHSIIILGLAGISALALFYGTRQQIGAYFLLLLLVSLITFAPLPLVVYRAYALVRASYRLERDGLRLRWGLRAEDIPLPEVEWVRRASELTGDLPLPRLHWPGALIGQVSVPDLGQIEYLASTTDTLLLIATPGRIYAISPDDPDEFLRAFQRTFELGSLTPLFSVSVLPAAYLAQVWSDLAARRILVLGMALNLLLLIGVSLIIPLFDSVSLGFYPDGQPLPASPAESMILLPILGTFAYLADLTAGLFFYRQPSSRTIAFIVWSGGVLTMLLLIGATWMIALTGQ